MPLSRSEIERLLRMVGATREVEIDCDRCLDRLAEFAERRLTGRSVDESLSAVEHHLTVCPECHEEYRALWNALNGADDEATA